MASVGFLIGGALTNALAFSGSNFCSVVYLKNQSIKNERDTIKQLTICNELKSNGLREDKNDWIILIVK